MSDTAEMPLRYHLEKTSSVAEGIARVRKAGLMLNDEETSQVMDLVNPDHTRSETIQDVWLAVDDVSGKDIGMAMVSDPTEDSFNLPVLNLFVQDYHQGLGIGKALLAEALKPHERLAGYYTMDSVRLYKDHNIVPAFMVQTEKTKQLLATNGEEEAQRLCIEATLQARVEHDKIFMRASRTPAP